MLMCIKHATVSVVLETWDLFGCIQGVFVLNCCVDVRFSFDVQPRFVLSLNTIIK